MPVLPRPQLMEGRAIFRIGLVHLCGFALKSTTVVPTEEDAQNQQNHPSLWHVLEASDLRTGEWGPPGTFGWKERQPRRVD
ncbi:hypothetical protein AXG93_150s1190 [Marchantia polymorpha subsp. ruderalis]|uniref:Uncharacterized protein n=1 Tax=Marchantia polymorpha subsp. ruderalis TaxID=1480154 RepID=A0A176WDH5_MARPO|nr:hypothetical protein AXG93_150s1190 [Marchantia polymorpha subsp. ruderalis]